ncbi:MAG: glycogen/starch/alpha-glucan phosphorylase, partial [Oscillospiraceae bacterium]|nr:glycogen/starch/alpha-glucan phosphorylase [Oscillospiraceae bacterium]
MLNGAVTLGTMDGANVEIAELVGEDNIYTFGESSETVIERYARGDYNPSAYIQADEDLRAAVDFLAGSEMVARGNEAALKRLQAELVDKDYFMTFPDFKDYCATKARLLTDMLDENAWEKKMLVNIAKAGFFSSDRTILEYNRDIWNLRA